MIVAILLVFALQDDGRDYQKYHDEDRAVAVSAPLLSKCFGSPNSASCAEQALDVCIGPWRQQQAINMCARTQRDLVRDFSLRGASSARSRSAFTRWERARQALCERASFFEPEGSGFPGDRDYCMIRAMLARAAPKKSAPK